MFKVVALFLISANQVLASNFTCSNGRFISASEICDGVANCADSSDERRELCAAIICQADQFKCYYGACVSREKFCDEYWDCIDGSDEFNCGKAMDSCESDEFRCSTSGLCIDSSLICNQVHDCPSGEDETQLCQPQICPNNTFRCSHDRCIDLEAVCDNFNDCVDGEDEADLLCHSLSCFGPDCDLINCPPINSDRILSSCTLNGHSTDCHNDSKPGTIVNYACKEFYQPASDYHKHNAEAVCQRNGKWSTKILQCEPKCGYLKAPVPLIVNGFESDVTFPWHATIYIRRENNFIFSCGATLVSESAILSAAHCFTHINESDLKVVIGKRHLNLTTKDELEQCFNVARIFRHPLYLDKVGNYGSDIALVELNQTVTLSDDIHPVCIDWELDDITSHLSGNQSGLIVGMGVTENETNSEVIRMAQLPIVSNEDCIKNQSRDFRKYITFTTFCAGWGNGTSVCNGDSGGGLIFLSKDLRAWKVQGVVSLSPRKQSTFFCDPFKFTVFTKVGLYIKWIRFVLEGIQNAITHINYDPIL